MKTYWDSTDLEKMNLTKAEVQSFIDIELMTKGVVKVTKPNFQEIKDVSEFEKVVYYEYGGILFRTIEQVNAFIQLNPMKEGYDYYGAGYDYKYGEPIESSIKNVSLFRVGDIKENSLLFKSNKTAKEFNEAETKRYEKEMSIMEDAVAPIWEDWHEKQGMARKCKKINDTYKEYLSMTKGDEALALEFLAKIYSQGEIELAKSL